MMKEILLAGKRQAVSNIFCIGRNYPDHIRELGNTTPEEPMAFLKPTGALLRADEAQPIVLPAYSESVHYECEVVLYIGEDLQGEVSEEVAWAAVAGAGIGLDLTARDVQAKAKAQGLPWLKCKGFAGAACVSDFVALNRLPENAADWHFAFDVNDERRQTGHTAAMIHSMPQLLCFLAHTYGLPQGSLVYTGTPSGVGQLHDGDKLKLALGEVLVCEFAVVAA